jgi:hypothetical protein
MSEIHPIIKQTQGQIDHYAWKIQKYLFNGWNQNLRKDKTLFSD